LSNISVENKFLTKTNYNQKR